MSDLETVPGVASLAIRKLDNGELVFTLEQADQVIKACTSAGLAVLGIEIFPGLNVSTYDNHLKDPANERHWPGYIRTSNILAEDFVHRNPASPTNECVLTTASWREFGEVKRRVEAGR